MKNKLLSTIFNSTLSCNSKCLRFFSMIYRKIFIGLFLLGFLSACGGPTAMIGPAYTLTSTGNIYHAGLNYGSYEMITRYTGKTPIENLQDLGTTEKNIHKNTIESEDFYILVKNKIEKTGAIFKSTNQ